MWSCVNTLAQQRFVQPDLRPFDQAMERGADAHQMFVLLDWCGFHGRPGQLAYIGQPKAPWTILIRLQTGLAEGEGFRQ